MKKLIIVLLLTICSVTLISNAYAHSGRTDSYGGHHNWKSDYGTYHYHWGN
ncbi:MAG: YHYH domain-containing protein [Candidatus Omnitrophota bacterium]